MLAKFGFLLLFLLFGASMFLLGVVLSDATRQALPALEKLKTPGPVAAAKAAPGASAGPAAGAGAADKAPPPVPLESLLVPAPLPAQGRYALQTGIFADAAQAADQAARINALHLPGAKALTLATRDRQGRDWWVVAAGERGAPDDLDDVRAWLNGRFAVADARAVLLPPEPKP